MFLLFSVVLVFLLPLTVAAHVGDVLYPLYELRDNELPDLHDGSLEDWQALFSEPHLTDADLTSFPEVGDGAAIGAPDLAVDIYFGWNKTQNQVYAGFEVRDDVYINEYPGVRHYSVVAPR